MEKSLVNYELQLDAKEILFLDDQLTLLVVATDSKVPYRSLAGGAGAAADIRLLEAIMSAVRSLYNSDGMLDETAGWILHVSKQDLLLLREVVKYDSMLGKELIGPELKYKIYNLYLGNIYDKEENVNTNQSTDQSTN